MVVKSLTVNGTTVTASLNKKSVQTAGAASITWPTAGETVAPGESIEFRAQADAGETVQVTAITVDVDNQI